jgi:hypothetical protein
MMDTEKLSIASIRKYQKTNPKKDRLLKARSDLVTCIQLNIFFVQEFCSAHKIYG